MNGFFLDRVTDELREVATIRAERLHRAVTTSPEGDWKVQIGHPFGTRTTRASDFSTLSLTKGIIASLTIGDTGHPGTAAVTDGSTVMVHADLRGRDGQVAREIAGTVLDVLLDRTLPTFDDRPWEEFAGALAASIGARSDGLLLHLRTPWRDGSVTSIPTGDDRPETAITDPAVRAEIEAMIPSWCGVSVQMTFDSIRIAVNPLTVPLCTAIRDPMATMRTLAQWPEHLRSIG